MRKYFLFILALAACGLKGYSQSAFTGDVQLKPYLCKTWVSRADSENFQFLDDKTFWFSYKDYKYFGRWDFDVKNQVIVADFSEDNIIDENFKIISITNNKFVCRVGLRCGGPTKVFELTLD